MQNINSTKISNTLNAQYGVTLEETASFLTQGSWGYRYETMELHQQVY